MKKNYFFLTIPLIPIIIILMANSSGSPGGKSGSPGDNSNTCTDCHTGSSNPVSGWITTNVPSEGYTPGDTYTITATGTHTGVGKFGFELTVEDQSGNKVGTLIITDATQTKFTNGSNAITHTSSGNTPSGNSKTWSMDWTAPFGVSGNIGIYAAFNAADGTGNTGGDVIYTSNTFISEVELDPEITGITPDEADQGETFTATITGENTGWSGSPDVSLSLSSNPSDVINATNVTVQNVTTIMADFSIPMDATAGSYDVNVDALSLDNGFTVVEVIQSLVSITPDDATQGDMITATVTGQNTTWDGTTPAVSLVLHDNPADVITGTGVNVSDNTHLDVDFDFAEDATIGMYDLHVDDLVLENAFTVEKLMYLTGVDPDIASQGEDLTVTISAFGTTFMNGVNSVNLSLNSNPFDIIQSSDINVLNDTELEASFMIPADATTGLYDVNVDALMLESAFTIVAGTPAILSILPNDGMQGVMVTTTITTQFTDFGSLTPDVTLFFHDDPAEFISATSVSVISDTELEVEFDIPLLASVGMWDLHVDDLELENGFEVLLTTGIDNPLMSTISIFPNPSEGLFNIISSENAIIEIFGLTGNMVYRNERSNRTNVIDLSGNPEGLYILRIVKDGSESVEKIVLR
jgi:hypothetical protein